MAWNDRGTGSAESIRTRRELEFAVFCIESLAASMNASSDRVYKALVGKGDVLRQYVVPCYETLHTQGRDYIVNDIREVMEERGVTV